MIRDFIDLDDRKRKRRQRAGNRVPEDGTSNDQDLKRRFIGLQGQGVGFARPKKVARPEMEKRDRLTG